MMIRASIGLNATRLVKDEWHHYVESSSRSACPAMRISAFSPRPPLTWRSRASGLHDNQAPA